MILIFQGDVITTVKYKYQDYAYKILNQLDDIYKS